MKTWSRETVTPSCSALHHRVLGRRVDFSVVDSVFVLKFLSIYRVDAVHCIPVFSHCLVFSQSDSLRLSSPQHSVNRFSRLDSNVLWDSDLMLHVLQ